MPMQFSIKVDAPDKIMTNLAHEVTQSQPWVDLEKILGGGKPNIVGIKVAQLNVLLALQLRTLVISQLPV